MLTEQLLSALRCHYVKPSRGAEYDGGWFIPEVGRNGLGGSRCDAAYVGFTSVSGRTLIGHELKVSRADWLHELNTPGKADAWADACHEWWLVVPDPAIVHDGELPHGWGLMTPGKARRFKVVTKAQSKPRDWQPPWWAVRSVMSRRDTLWHKEFRDQMDREMREWEEHQRKRQELAAADSLTFEQRNAIEVVAQLRETYGLKVGDYFFSGSTDAKGIDIETFAKAVTIARELTRPYYSAGITKAQRQAEEAVNSAMHTASRLAAIRALLDPQEAPC